MLRSTEYKHAKVNYMLYTHPLNIQPSKSVSTIFIDPHQYYNLYWYNPRELRAVLVKSSPSICIINSNMSSIVYNRRVQFNFVTYIKTTLT